MNGILVIIPARLGSTRFQSKVLIEREGKTLLEWTWARAMALSGNVVISTPDSEVFHLAQMFGAVVHQSGDHSDGTHRVAETYKHLEQEQPKKVINWQVDEPYLNLDDVSQMVGCTQDIGTLAYDLVDPDDLNAVKVVQNPKTGKAYWFSRAPMGGAFHHVGIYCFRPSIVGWLGDMEPSHHAKVERLEQLTWLEHEIGINVLVGSGTPPLSVNTPAEGLRFAGGHLEDDRNR